MKAFEYHIPTKLYYGLEEENKVGEILRSFGASKVLFHYGKASIKKTGLYDRVIASLQQAKLPFVELSGVQANPTLKRVEEGIALAKKEKIDFILAVGGGSVIDSAKLIANGFFYDGNPFDFNLHQATPKKALPVGVILTIAAAGSECSTSCVITNEETKEKRGFNADTNRPLFAIENPILTYSLPKEQTIYGIVDILAHTLERYFSPSDVYEFADDISEGLLRSVIRVSEEVIRQPDSEACRKVLLLASSLSHNGLTSIGKSYTMPVHQLEHEISGFHDEIAHGLGLAILFPYWMRTVVSADVKKFAAFARHVFFIQETKDEIAAEKGILAFEKFLSTLGLPKTLQEVGIQENEIETLALAFSQQKRRIVSSIVPIDYEVAKQIYRRAYKGE